MSRARSERRSAGPAGLLVIDKPAGPTSHDVVDAVRRLVRTRRVGHTGTLDPAATGVLLVLTGAATRLSPLLTGLVKEYVGVVRFGRSTTTDDAEGETVAEAPPRFGRADLERALPAFRGEIRQRPPAVSAVRVRGERSWKRARRGEGELPPERTVHVHSLDLVAYEPPDARLRVVCSSGTYIRSLARDLGAALGTPAHLARLRRTRVGPFSESVATPLADLEAGGGGCRLPLVAPAEALPHLPSRRLDDAEVEAVRHGRAVAEGAIDPPAAEEPAAPGGPHVRLLDSKGRLVAVARREGGRLRPRVVLPPETSEGTP